MAKVSLIVALLLVLAADTAAAAPEAAGDTERQCLSDQSLCIVLENGSEDAELSPQLKVTQLAKTGAVERETILPLPFEPGEREWLTLSPQLLVLPKPAFSPEASPAPVLVGILANHSVMYSGGGGAGARLHLFEMNRDYHSPRLAGERLAVPWTSSLMIRACFSEHDLRDRRGACHDEYRFAAMLNVSPPATGQAWPELTYQTKAESFPQTADRVSDGSGQRLKRSDLVWRTDAECSYTRQLRFNPASERYEMDRPAPECSDFTVP